LQVVVFHDQQLLDRPRDELRGARQRLLQGRVIHRLFEHGECAHLQTALARILDRDDVNRDVPRVGAALENVEQPPAIHVRQIDVQRYQRRTEATHQRQRAAAGRRHYGLEAAIVRQIEQNAAELRIVLDDQQHALAGPDVLTIVGQLGRHQQRRRLASDDHLPALLSHQWSRGVRRQVPAEVVSDRQIQREATALARRALDRDLAAEQATDLAADRQAEPGAAVLATGRAVGLLERFEDHAQLVAGDADTGVSDRVGDDCRRRLERDVRGIPATARTAYLQLHAALVREFER